MYLQKLVFSLVILSTFGLTASAQARDHIRISFVGFNCNSETADNMFEMDGKGDEIFVNCNWIMTGSRSDKGGIRSGGQRIDNDRDLGPRGQ